MKIHLGLRAICGLTTAPMLANAVVCASAVPATAEPISAPSKSSSCEIVGSRLVAFLDSTRAPAGTPPEPAVVEFMVRHKGRPGADRIVVILDSTSDALALEYEPMDSNVVQDVASVSCSDRRVPDRDDVGGCGGSLAPMDYDRGDIAKILSVELSKSGFRIMYNAYWTDLGAIVRRTFSGEKMIAVVDGTRMQQAIVGRAPLIGEFWFPLVSRLPTLIAVAPAERGSILPTSRLCLGN